MWPCELLLPELPVLELLLPELPALELLLPELLLPELPLPLPELLLPEPLPELLLPELLLPESAREGKDVATFARMGADAVVARLGLSRKEPPALPQNVKSPFPTGKGLFSWQTDVRYLAVLESGSAMASGQRSAAISRSLNFWILPLAVRGKPSTTAM